MCGSHDSEGSLLPMLRWKLRMIQAGAENALENNALRFAAPQSGGAKAAKKKPKTTAKTTK